MRTSIIVALYTSRNRLSDMVLLCWLFALSDLPNACYLFCQAGVGFVQQLCVCELFPYIDISLYIILLLSGLIYLYLKIFASLM